MAGDGQQYSENFSEEAQYSEYNQQNYGESMEEGGDSNQNGTNGDSTTKTSADDDRKLFIGGISWDTDQKDIKEYFSKFGEVADVTIKTDPTTGKSRGFGFITFAADETVDAVLKAMPHTIKGKQIDPKRAKARPGIKKIFVGGLDIDYPEADIRSYFEKFGKIENIELPFDKMKNQRRQFCFVTFETEAACDLSTKEAKQTIGKKECDVKKATNGPNSRGGRGGPFGGPGGRGGRGRGRGGPGFNQPQGWNAGYGAGGYGAQGGYGGYGAQGGYGGYGTGYGGGYDYGYGGGYGAGGYGNYDYSGYYGNQAGGYGAAGYGQQASSFGKTPRGGRGAATGAAATTFHPYSR